jgi:hypothetical protein
MVGPQRKQRKPTVSRESGTHFKFKFEKKNKEEKLMAKYFMPAKGTRKRPLMLTGKTVPVKENKETKKTDERIWNTLDSDEA